MTEGSRGLGTQLDDLDVPAAVQTTLRVLP